MVDRIESAGDRVEASPLKRSPTRYSEVVTAAYANFLDVSWASARMAGLWGSRYDSRGPATALQPICRERDLVLTLPLGPATGHRFCRPKAGDRLSSNSQDWLRRTVLFNELRVSRPELSFTDSLQCASFSATCIESRKQGLSRNLKDRTHSKYTKEGTDVRKPHKVHTWIHQLLWSTPGVIPGQKLKWPFTQEAPSNIYVLLESQLLPASKHHSDFYLS